MIALFGVFRVDNVCTETTILVSSFVVGTIGNSHFCVIVAHHSLLVVIICKLSRLIMVVSVIVRGKLNGYIIDEGLVVGGRGYISACRTGEVIAAPWIFESSVRDQIVFPMLVSKSFLTIQPIKAVGKHGLLISIPCVVVCCIPIS